MIKHKSYKNNKDKQYVVEANRRLPRHRFVQIFITIIILSTLVLPQKNVGAISIFDEILEGSTSLGLSSAEFMSDFPAGLPVTDQGASVTKLKDKILQKIGVSAYNFAIKRFLNKIAYDTATWLGSGKEGQQPLFVQEDWGKYLLRMGDEAAGDFLETAIVSLRSSGDRSLMKVGSLMKKYSTPHSLNSLLQISLGLENKGRNPEPRYSASEMVAGWKNEFDKYRDYTSEDFLSRLPELAHPAGGDIGIYSEILDDMLGHESRKVATINDYLIAFKGYTDPRNIAGNLLSLPGQAEADKKLAEGLYAQSMFIYTGNALADAANVFVNQLALSGYNKLMRSLAEKISKTSGSAPIGGISSFSADPNYSGGRPKVEAIVRKSLTTDFKVVENYNTLAQLRACPDTSNLGASNCVINDSFMQAIMAKKTVAEAIAEGYLNGDWQFVIDGGADSYEKNFSWRNISILRKHRVVPASWELVFKKLEQLRAGELDGISNVKSKEVTLRDLVSCFSPYDEYNDFSNSFDITDQAWCTGLVDPNWVLKMPASYCAKEGYGSQIIESISNILIRADNYCADYQTCIKENRSGDCDAYGYCNEEKRIWRFEANICEPINNTCQGFINPNTKEKIAFLENTLDHSICNADNAGCKQYTNSGSFNQSSGQVDWTVSDSLYFNNQLESCAATAEGCEEIIRVKSAWGDNLVMNSNFSNDTIGDTSTGEYLNEWTLGPTNNRATIVDVYIELEEGVGRAIKLEGNPALLYSDGSNKPRPVGPGGGGMNPSGAGGGGGATNPDDDEFAPHYNLPLKGKSLLPNNFSLISGRIYTVSADVYLEAGSKVVIALGSGAGRSTYESEVVGQWHHISVSKEAGSEFTEPSFSLAAYDNAVVYVKNIKFEMSPWDTGFSTYANKRTYQKLLPNYLKNICYIGEGGSGSYSYQLRPNAPAECNNYARECSAADVGCELYSSSQDNFSIPAKLSDLDYCAEECVGYDRYINRETYFFSAQVESIIPRMAQTCSADAVGCTEFTNLDEIASGGEQREYYSQLKQCVKPSQGICKDFYYWEGTEKGYQLHQVSLKDNFGEPAVVADDSELCNESIFKAPITSVDYNPDCRQYYNSAGEIFYHLESYTITCSDNCRSYRLTEKNLDFNISQNECIGVDKKWDNQEGGCVYCKNGGIWSAEHSACIYQAIPNEGKICQAAQNSCREYSGSVGNNVRLVTAHNFEHNYHSWSSNCKNGIEIVEIANEQGGHSLYYNNNASQCSPVGGAFGNITTQRMPLIKNIIAGDDQAAQLSVGLSVVQNKSYNIKFWAKSIGTQIKMYFLNPETGDKAYFNNGEALSVSGDGWQMYSLDLENLDHEVAVNEMLILTANQDFYFDNFVLTEISDRYYLIKSSNRIPDICYYDILDNYQGADYNLGCTTYTDRSGAKHNLHSFSSLCSSDVVGCEQVIKTNNYNPYQTGIWNDVNGNGRCDANEPDCVIVPEDQTAYIIYDAKKVCNAADMGCQRLGEAVAGTNASVWSDVFKKNNPNKYSSILCEEEAAGCEAWQLVDGGGYSYFRDPGKSYCVYRSPRSGGPKEWLQAPVKRCDVDGDGVISGNEILGPICTSNSQCNNQNCITDINDYPCKVTYNLTIGHGGAGKHVPVPSQQVGLCDIQESSCREYIDPVSSFNPNLLTISEQDALNKVHLQPNKLYALSFVGDSSAEPVQLNFSFGVTTLDVDNNFSDPVRRLISSYSDPYIIFNSKDNQELSKNISEEAKHSIILRELAIEYVLASELHENDCHGVYNLESGCVLFNERSYDGGAYNSLKSGYNPLKSSNNKSAAKCDPEQPGSCLANTLLQVKPDRVCSTWLDCDTYIFDENNNKVCFSLRPCNSLDDKGDCNNFISRDYVPNLNNATGYYILGQNSIGGMKELGLNSSAHYDFEEFVPSISCVHLDDPERFCSFDNTNIVNSLIIRSDDERGVDYPVSGSSYLKVPGSKLKISPQPIGSYFSLSSGQDYYLSYYLNTKTTGAKLHVLIEPPLAGSGEPGSHVASFTASSPKGWEKQVHKFSTSLSSNSTGEDVKARISFYVEGVNEIAYVDDVNIEPVLQISENNYAARECRLYPNMGSYACIDNKGSITSQGLEGYCLERDKLNPYVCNTWYPVDRISSSLINASNVGYSGPVGLNYCTKVEANFGYAKKIVAKLVAVNQDKSSKGHGGLIPNQNKDKCYREFSDLFSAEMLCGSATNYELIGINDEKNLNYEFLYCIPRTSISENPGFLFSEHEPMTIHDLTGFHDTLDDASCNFRIYPSAWVDLGDEGGLLSGPITTLCTHKDENFSGYNPIESLKNINVCGPVTEFYNADPPIMIYDKFNKPNNFVGLKYISSDSGSGNQDKVFKLPCIELDQRVAHDGSNQAWVVRTGVNANVSYNLNTPSFFENAINPLRIEKYGRLTVTPPYGAATIPLTYDLLNSEIIYLKNQYYQKQPSLVYAGRPYGCVGESCKYVGFCSGNPDVFCTYYQGQDATNAANYINTNSCSDGGFGICQQLWTEKELIYFSGGSAYHLIPVSSPVDLSAALDQIFRRSYGRFSYDAIGYAPVTMSISSNIPVGSSPIINNVKLYHLGTKAEITGLNIGRPGVYELKFNININPEQLPLRMIFIDWGDGNKQAFTGLDSKTNPDDPHVFYHYYVTRKDDPIVIKVWDNWEVASGAWVQTGSYKWDPVSPSPSIPDIN